MALFTGSGVAIVTPMRENGDVNEEKLGELIEFQIANKTDAIIIVGTTGEGSTLSNEEHIATIAYAVKKVNGRVPVIAGTGSNDTKYSCQLSRAAEIAGADGCLLVAPYYNKATQNGLIRHFITTANLSRSPASFITSRRGQAATSFRRRRSISRRTARTSQESRKRREISHRSRNCPRSRTAASTFIREMTTWSSRSFPSAARASSPCWQISRRARHTTWSSFT